MINVAELGELGIHLGIIGRNSLFAGEDLEDQRSFHPIFSDAAGLILPVFLGLTHPLQVFLQREAAGSGVAGDVVLNKAELVLDEDFGGRDFGGANQFHDEVVAVLFHSAVAVLSFKVLTNIGLEIVKGFEVAALLGEGVVQGWGLDGVDLF